MNKRKTTEAVSGKLLYTMDEAAQVLSLGRTLLYDLVMPQHITTIKVGRSRRVPHTALVEFVERLMQAS